MGKGRLKQRACSYPDIAGLLDEIGGLRGRYIVLPNVSQGNRHTALRAGAHGDFRRMGYVGGYLDRGQTIATLSAKLNFEASDAPVWVRPMDARPGA